jgi:hypothetical protein
MMPPPNPELRRQVISIYKGIASPVVTLQNHDIFCPHDDDLTRPNSLWNIVT